jgi:galactokinase
MNYTPERWLARLDSVNAGRLCQPFYGRDPERWRPRLEQWRAALIHFRDRFGAMPVILVRCPGRVNLRGMHVDTHGGYLNVMTHQREVVVVAAASDDGASIVANTDPAFPESAFALADLPAIAPDCAWDDFIASPAVRRHTEGFKGDWGLYIRGAVQSFSHRTHCAAKGVRAVVASDLPHGAALSASHAICVATLLALEHLNQFDLSQTDRILAAREAEWYAGARTGTSDQSAMILGRKDSLVAGPLPPSDLDLARVRTIPWPDSLALVVAQSFTRRNLSGSDRLAYSANRFAYSVALDLYREALDLPAASFEHLYQLSEKRFGNKRLLGALRKIPARIAVDALRARCREEVFEEAYQRYFGNIDPGQRPTDVPLRGPLIFAIAESERARCFAECIEQGKFETAGAMMTLGHAGDRRVADGKPYAARIDDAELRMWETSDRPVWMLPGAYGASSPALDCLVDAALHAGAYGASLTGAGIAGVVLALCPTDRVDAVVAHIRDTLASNHYAATAGLCEPITRAQAQAGIVLNHAPAAAAVVGEG